jgi:hypothetical protein
MKKIPKTYQFFIRKKRKIDKTLSRITLIRVGYPGKMPS